MPYVDASRRAVNATSDQQAARPKLSVTQVDNGDGTFSYYPTVYLQNPEVSIDGSVSVTYNGSTPQTDTFEDALGVSHVAQVMKLRFGAEGIDEGLVSSRTPLPTVNQDQLSLLAEALGELKVIRLLLEGIVR